jgi:hypothetical protein
MRRLTELISEGFIWGVGITRPKEGRQERVAALYITTALIASILAVIGMFVLLLHRLSLH